MRLLPFVLLALGAADVKADLSCLEWVPISPIVGLICHFAPKTYNAAEEATVKAVEDAATSVKALAKFDLTHNPATLTYNYIETTANNGSAAANAALGASLKDYSDVTIGFGKESVNQGVQIYNLLDWSDVSLCLVSGAAKLPSLVPTQQRRRAAPIAGLEVMAKGCLKDKLNKPLPFDIKGQSRSRSLSSRPLPLEEPLR